MATTGGDLPPEMVRCIAQQADVGCRARVRAVCSLWSALVPANLPQPWVLLQPAAAATAAAERGRESDDQRFRVLSLPANRELTLSRAFSGGCGVAGARCVGAAHGWLALVGADLGRRRPGRRHRPAPPGTQRRRASGPRPAEEVRDRLVQKIVFSPAPEQDDYFAVQLLFPEENGVPPFALYARAGATRWKTLHDKDENPFKLLSDVLHAEGGRFFAVAWGYGDVYQFDLAAHGGVDDDDHGEEEEEEEDGAFAYNADNEEEDDYDPYAPSFTMLAPPLYSRQASWYYPREDLWHVVNHLVLVDGELYQVWAKWGHDGGPAAPGEEDAGGGYVVIEEAGVLRCDLDGHTYSEVAAGELDDWAVLAAANETAAVRAGDMSGLRGNRVYFIDGHLEKVAGAFDLRTRRAEAVECEMLRRAWPGGPWRRRSPQPVWFLPSYADATAQAGRSPRPSRSSPPQGRHHEQAKRKVWSPANLLGY
ncbi:hypothetical protein ACP4OV_026780 [Aristida adscensionis]